ncbi:MAG: transglutaminase domain-containing protein [Anaerolineales bacterium]|nr:transglutaminase domain-containing protein [Anaerolineales bacterium]
MPWRAHRDLDHGDRYTFISAATEATVQDVATAGEAYPPEIVDRYIQIPQGFSQRVTDLAKQLTVGATTPYAKAKAIESYLRTFPYNDAIAAPPEGVDPLEYFLFDIREGYCDYYATAMAMMLRVVGVPARAVSGYAEGIYDEENGVYFVTERDAHTWVEVFFPEYGWIEFEPTAGETPLERPASDNDATNITSQTEEQTPQPESPLGAPTPPAERPPEDLPPQFTGDELLQSPGNDLFGLPWWGWMLLMLLVLPVGVWFIWRARSVGPTAFTPDLPAILYERIALWTHRLGIGPAVGQTPFETGLRISYLVLSRDRRYAIRFTCSASAAPLAFLRARSIW